MTAPIAFSIAFYALIGVFTFYITRNRKGDAELPRPRTKPFEDAGGYLAHGDWPFVPSDLLKSRFHARSNRTEDQ